MTKSRQLTCFTVLIISDVAALLASFLIAYFLRSTLLVSIISGFEQPPLPLATQLRHGFFYGVLIIVFIFSFDKLYTRRFAFWEETKHLLKSVTYSFIFIAMLVFISRGYAQFSRAVIILAWLLSLFLFPLFRLIIKNLLVKLNLWKKKVIIFGTNGLARLVANEIKNNSTLGYEVAGFLTDDREKIGNNFAESKIIGEFSDIEKMSKDLGIKDVIIALPDIPNNKLSKVIAQCEKTAETIRIIPGLGNLYTIGVEIENFGDVLSLSIACNLLKPWNIFIKGLFEFIVAIILSVLLLPLFLVIALAIKTDSHGPVFFVQDRLGWKHREKFKFYKFRSMYMDADKRLEKYLHENPDMQKEWNRYHKIKSNDPRVTRVGKFIRKYSLDELPQIINFFKRDMSLVGPRPYMPREINKIGKRIEIISRVKPGITGLWQVRGRNLLSFRDRLLLDEYYIRNWSLWLDIIILWKTIKVLITREGAY